MADKCTHEWFPGFFSCICLNCKKSIPFDGFITEYGQQALSLLCDKASKDYDKFLKEQVK